MFFLWKNIGETPLACLDRFRESFSEYKEAKLSYVGRLDPIAEGLLPVIEGEENSRREDFLGLKKEYIATFLTGVSTDSYDILGLPKKRTMPGFFDLKIGTYMQPYPPYSSKTVSGKPLWQWSREGKISEITLPTHEVTIYAAEQIHEKNIKSGDLYEHITKTIDLVSGDFRQKEIMDAWTHFLKKEQDEWCLRTVRLTVSSGAYIRSLAYERGATLFALTRTRIW